MYLRNAWVLRRRLPTFNICHGIVGDDAPDAGRPSPGQERHLAALRETEDADAARVHSWKCRKPFNRVGCVVGLVEAAVVTAGAVGPAAHGDRERDIAEGGEHLRRLFNRGRADGSRREIPVDDQYAGKRARSVRAIQDAPDVDAGACQQDVISAGPRRSARISDRLRARGRGARHSGRQNAERGGHSTAASAISACVRNASHTSRRMSAAMWRRRSWTLR